LVALVFGAAILAGGVWGLDWGVWELRVLSGGGMGKVQVTDLLVTPLKNNKEEYDWGGTIEVDCSRSIFQHAGRGACWQLERSKVFYDR
jgi:hypothetical protein